MKNDKIKAEKRGFEVKTIIGIVCPDIPEDIDNFMKEYDDKIRADTLDSVKKKIEDWIRIYESARIKEPIKKNSYGWVVRVLEDFISVEEGLKSAGKMLDGEKQ